MTPKQILQIFQEKLGAARGLEEFEKYANFVDSQGGDAARELYGDPLRVEENAISDMQLQLEAGRDRAAEEAEYGTIRAPESPRQASAAMALGGLGRRLEGSPMALMSPEATQSRYGKEAYGEDSSAFETLMSMSELSDVIPGVGVAKAGVAATIPLVARGTRALREYADDGAAAVSDLALPNPERAAAQNIVARQDAWSALEKSSRGAGEKRNKRTGRYVGGPADTLSPQKRAAVVRQYADRIETALDEGIPKGYFYDEGQGTLRRLTDSPEEHKLVADLYGPTSTQVGPYQNTNYTVRALDQHAMGVPSHVTLYPNAQRPKVDSVLAGEDPWKGFKVDRYSYLLGPRDPHVHELQKMPPNDQWEGYGAGFPKGYVPGNTAQVAYADDIRRRAADRVNAKRAEKGLPPLTLPEAQELHWAAIRAETEDRPLVLGPNDTLQGSFPAFEVQHAWEAEPGATSGASREAMSKQEYADEVYGLLADDQGKDRLVRAMGGRLQEPIVRGTGVWEGELSPGFQSRSFASWTGERGMDPASYARVDSTEAVRQYMLGQEGRAFTQMGRDTSVAGRNIADVQTGRPPTPEETAELQARIGDAGVVSPKADGYRVKWFVDQDGRSLTSAVEDLPGFNRSYGQDTGGYAMMDWSGGNATRGLLDVLDEAPPGAARLADSPATREIAGSIAALYQRLEAEGKLSPNQRLVDALEAWRSQGLAGLRKLVEMGLAPSALLAVLSQYDPAAPGDESSRS